jgi:hypothetical protein
MAGRGERDSGVFGSQLDIEPESLGERLKALFKAGSYHLFFAPEWIAVPLADALAERGAEVGLRLERRRLVEAIAFSFRAEVFSREARDGYSWRPARLATAGRTRRGALGSGGNPPRGARTGAVCTVAFVHLPRFGTNRRTSRRCIAGVAAYSGSRFLGNQFNSHRGEVASCPDGIVGVGGSVIHLGGRNAATEEPRHRDQRPRPTGDRQRDLRPAREHGREGAYDTPPASPPRPPRPGSPAGLEEQAPAWSPRVRRGVVAVTRADRGWPGGRGCATGRSP